MKKALESALLTIRLIQWAGDYRGGRTHCPSCDGSISDGHAADCRIPTTIQEIEMALVKEAE